MNPLRTVLLSLSRIPPALMLTIIIGVAAVVSLVVVNEETKRTQALNITIEDMQRHAQARTKVVYLTKDIPENATIPADALEEKDIEASRAPMDSVAAAAMAIGRVAKYPMQQGSILSTHDLAPQGVQLGFDARLKSGQRAVTFAVDSNSGVAGFISPDSHVDIMGMVGSGADTRVGPILSDVEVIAVGQLYEKQARTSVATPASSVTVAVTPEDTQKLIKAVAASKLYLALRNANDHVPVATVDVTALFPVKVDNSLTTTASRGNDLPAPPTLPLPGMPDAPNSQPMPGFPQANTTPLPPPLHEIEIWTGAKKDVVTVPKG
ncbi:MAG: Flp pilus assembly protein CpaB [Cyanobacteria bacterium SZAS LIN-2]|nr:Flp pilus assembly protein CpaB [Cyanobacteria bacterium SZAS LIN-3]MBS1998149.1 Flp pilus assembly protein CpaB [Cyanobacteria bacterium SZAS LIN-2]MBS2006417.1 Flp pilus assembly protein CpaB [Cyanobacteria bacterium SZAS TMP-1]